MCLASSVPGHLARDRTSHLARVDSSHLPGVLATLPPYTEDMNIFLADPHPQVRSALSLVLNRLPGVRVIGETGDARQILSSCRLLVPDLVLLDPEMVRDDLAGLLAGLRQACPGVQVAALSTRPEAGRVALAGGLSHQSGCDGWISKTEPPDLFCQKILAFQKKE